MKQYEELSACDNLIKNNYFCGAKLFHNIIYPAAII